MLIGLLSFRNTNLVKLKMPALFSFLLAQILAGNDNSNLTTNASVKLRLVTGSEDSCDLGLRIDAQSW